MSTAITNLLLLLSVALSHCRAATVQQPSALVLPASAIDGGDSSGGSGRVAALLPPGQQLRLFSNGFDSIGQACTDAEVLRGSFPTFSLPTDGQQLSLLLQLASLDCSNKQQGVLLAFGSGSSAGSSSGGSGSSPAVDVVVDCATQQLLLASSSGGSSRATYQLPAGAISTSGGGSSSSSSSLVLLLTQDQQQGSFGICVDGQQLPPLAGSSAALLQELAGSSSSSGSSSESSLLGPAVFIGARSDSTRSARADLAAAYVADVSIPCQLTQPGERQEALLQALADAAAAGRNAALAAAPAAVAVAVEQQPAGGGFDAVVEEPVRLTVTVTVPCSSSSQGDSYRLRLTFFGLVPEGCTAAECGDRVLSAPAAAVAPGQPATLAATVTYPKAGRHVMRVEVSSMRGLVSTRDHGIMVRKHGDPATLLRTTDGGAGADGGAPCCRHSPGVVAQQLGRPVSDVQYRSGTAGRQAAVLGWSEEYMQHEDVEAERLFDYGVLAPAVTPTPLRLTTCQDTRLAGAGSPVLWGTNDALASHSRGHNKRLAFVPAGFDWVSSADQIACQQHWSGWHKQSPRTLPAGGADGGVCSTVCTQAGTLQLMRETGMFDQYNEALIAASYGQLSLSADVAVLPETYIPYNSTAADNFTYYEAPARQALTAAGVDAWMSLVLVPLANHRVPPFRAWSGGRAAGSAVVTQCFPTYYYAVHETGHRMNFRHANMYKLESATSAPANPLGAGKLTTNGYSDQLDIMACCKGDYGLFYRTMAGWLSGGERTVMSTEQVAAPGQTRFSLWPFDRSESRGNLMSLSIRRSQDEVLLVGFRAAAHWQDVSLAGGVLAPQESRHNVRGLTVELIRRDPRTGAWPDHRGSLDFNVLKGDWPDALPGEAGAFPRQSHFAALKEGTAWHDAASGLLLSFEAVGGCQGAPGLPLYNHTANDFFGFRGEWPFQESFQRADYSGFHGLECAQLVITTAAPEPQGRLQFTVEAAAAAVEAATEQASVPPSTTTAGQGSGDGSRRRLLLQPQDTAAGQIAPGSSSSSSGSAAVSSSCGVPLAPTPRLRLPAGQQLASVIWKDSLNRTVLVQSGVSLAAASSAAGGGASWTTAAVALPPLYPFQESSSSTAAGCTGGSRATVAACRQLQARYSVLLLAPDGRHSRADVSMAPASLAGQQLTVRYKHYEPRQLSYSQETITVPLSWPAVQSSGTAGDTVSAAADAPAGVALFDSSAAGGQQLLLQRSSSAVVAGSSLPSSSCSRQWSLSLLLSISGASLAAAARDQAGQLLLSVDGGYPAVSLGPSQLPAAPTSLALWLHWGAYRSRLVLPPSFTAAADAKVMAGGIRQQQQLHLVLVRDGGRLGLWADQQGGWLIRYLSCVPSRHSITYCDHAPNTASNGSSSSSFRPPAEIRLGAAAVATMVAPADGAAAVAAAADAGLQWARFYSYALPEGDLAVEEAAGKLQLLQYFRLLPSEGSSSGRGAGDIRVLLVSPPKKELGGGCSSGTDNGGGGGGGGGLPVAILGAGGGGALLVAAVVGGCCWCRRRRQRRLGQQHEQGRAAALGHLATDSASSIKSGVSRAGKIDIAASSVVVI